MSFILPGLEELGVVAGVIVIWAIFGALNIYLEPRMPLPDDCELPRDPEVKETLLAWLGPIMTAAMLVVCVPAITCMLATGISKCYLGLTYLFLAVIKRPKGKPEKKKERP